MTQIRILYIQGGSDDVDHNEGIFDSHYNNAGMGTGYQGKPMNNMNKSGSGRGTGIRSLMDPDFDVSSNSEVGSENVYLKALENFGII